MSVTSQTFNGDRPIAARSEDRLGFGPAALHVAHAINALASPDGFVIGIEGEWGSGKSSFINLVTDGLSSFEKAPEVVRFLPWLISSRDALLQELFAEIAKAALRIDLKDAPDPSTATWLQRGKGWFKPNRHSVREERRKKLENLFETFSSRLAAVGKLTEIAATLGVPLASGIGSSIGAGSDAASRLLSRKPLKDEKEKLQHELGRLSRKVVVFIDDLDRLEPAEACEVLRLVRAVADFPNIVYVLCYSRPIVARNLAVALGIENAKGEEFIEKIVQATFTIPQPEAFDLRRMFRRELQQLFPSIVANEDPSNRRMQERLAAVIDIEGGRTLRTPRHVVRTINALRFYATPVLEQIDLPDMVWLQLIRVRCLALYQWIEGYMTGASAIKTGASISPTGKKALADELTAIFEGADKDTSTETDKRWSAISEFLPGVEWRAKSFSDSGWQLHAQDSEDRTAERIAGRRLGSPQHHRFYFALSPPSGAIADHDFESFLALAEQQPQEAAAAFREMSRTPRPQGGVVAEALFDRLHGSGLDAVPTKALPGLLLALADGCDDVALTTGEGDFGKYWVWTDAKRILKNALRRFEVSARNDVIERLFGAGRSLGWLTDVFRGEIFDHGIYGERPIAQSEWMLSAEEFLLVKELLLDRYRNLGPAEVRGTPGLASTFYAWVQAVPKAVDEIRAKFADLSRDDADFIELLNAMRSWLATNGEVSHPLRESQLHWLMDFEVIEQRLESLAKQANDPILRKRAAELVRAISRKSEDI